MTAAVERDKAQWICNHGELLSMRVDVVRGHKSRAELDDYFQENVFDRGLVIGRDTFASGFAQVLIEACTWGKTDAIDYILEEFSRHIDINATVTYRPLIVNLQSAKEAPTECTRTYLQATIRGPLVSKRCTSWLSRDEGTDSDLEVGISSRVKVVQRLVSKGAALDDVLLVLAVRHCQEDASALIRCLVENGADLNYRDSRGWTPLMFAALTRSGNALVTTTLLEMGADPYITNEQGYAAMHIAAVMDNVPFLRALLTCGVDPLLTEQPANGGVASPLYLACVNYLTHGLRGQVTHLLLEHQTCLPSMQADVLRLEAMFHFITYAKSGSEHDLKIFESLAIRAKAMEDGAPILEQFVEEPDKLNKPLHVIVPTVACECLTVTMRCLGLHHEAVAYARLVTTNWLMAQGHKWEVDTDAFQSFLLATPSSTPESKCIQEFMRKKYHLLSQAAATGLAIARNLVDETSHRHQQPYNMVDFIKCALAAVLQQYLSHYSVTKKAGLASTFVDTLVMMSTRSKRIAGQIFSFLLEDASTGTELLHMVLIELQTGSQQKRRTTSIINLLHTLLKSGGFKYVNETAHTGNRLLHTAIIYLPKYPDARLTILSLLLKYGAHADAVDASGNTPISLCSYPHVHSFLLNTIGFPPPLSCLACRSVVNHKLPYQSLPFPQHIKTLIGYHETGKPAKCIERK